MWVFWFLFEVFEQSTKLRRLEGNYPEVKTYWEQQNLATL